MVQVGDRSATGVTAEAAAADFAPYVPRLVVDWLQTRPDARWQALDGTLAFVDLSGFTAMSERLDPEEVHGIMDRVF